MTSGIYKFTFSDGSFYIGKSSNIDKRWKQHQKAMVEGTHTKRIQQAYNQYGTPVYEVIFFSHPDHIDILESLFILEDWNDAKILNTTKPTAPEITNTSDIPAKYWNMGTAEHVRLLVSLEAENKKLKSKEREKNVKELVLENLRLNARLQELSPVKAKNWFERMLGI